MKIGLCEKSVETIQVRTGQVTGETRLLSVQSQFYHLKITTITDRQ